MSAERWLVASVEYAGLTPYTGGIGRHYAALLPALAARVAVDLVVVAEGPLDDPLDAGVDLGGVRLVKHVDLDPTRSRRALRSAAGVVRSVYARGRYDRVFVPEWGALGARLPSTAPLLTNLATSARLSHEIAGMRLRDVPRERRAAVRAQIRAETRQIRRSAGLLPISAAMRERTTAILRRDVPTEIVPNCIDVARVQNAAVSASLPAGWPSGGPVVLFLGRAERRKGVEDAVAAFAAAAERHPSARLVLAGAGGDARMEPTRSDLAAALPLSARDRLVWLGHVAGDELYAAIRAADVTLCPSRWEGFGQVALEAKAIGSPLVATSGSGFDDFCVDGVDSLLVPPADPAALATAIDEVLTHPDAARARAARARREVGAFAPEPIAERLRAAADRLLGPVRRAP